MHGERSKQTIIRTAIALWHEGGERAVSARAIGKRIALTHAGVLFHFDGVAGLMLAVKNAAIEAGDVKIIPQLITAGDPAVAHFTDEQRRAWLNAAA